MERVCDECAERERRQKAGGCQVCGNEIENPDGAASAICSDCYAKYIATNWAFIDAACRAADAGQSDQPIEDALGSLPSALEKKLAVVRVNEILPGNPVVVRQADRRT